MGNIRILSPVVLILFWLTVIKLIKDSNKSFVTKRFSILLIQSGYFKINVSGTIANLIKEDIFIIPPNSVCLQLSGSTKLKILVTSFTPDFVFKNFIKKGIIDLLHLFINKNAIKIEVSESDFLILTLTGKLVSLLFNENKKNNTESKLLTIGIDFFLLGFASILSKYEMAHKTGLSDIDVLMWRFFSLLADQGTIQHGINFYAESLCVTKGYLSKIVKQKTGRTIKGLIAEMIIFEAKKMLDGNISIIQIAQQLEFNSVSSFSTFFKKHTKVTPSAYRLDRE